MRFAALCLLVAACAASLLTAPDAWAITSADGVARTNALRAANGIPADLIDDPALSAGCQAHAHYGVLNDGFDAGAPHDEKPTKAGYSPEGADAAQHSVLSSGRGWTDPNPWFSAPYHLWQVLDPWLTRTGYGEERGYVCFQTLQGPRRQLPRHAIYTFPGPGASAIPPAVTAFENDSSGNPRVPGDGVGLPGGTATGPYIMVYTGDWTRASATRLESASLAGPAGPVDVVVADDRFVIPRRPLAPSTQYTAAVAVRFSGEECIPVGSGSWSAAVPPCPPEIPTYCVPATDPFPADARICEPGETPYLYIYTFPDEVVTHQWSFTTSRRDDAVGGRPGRRRAGCRPRVAAPRRVVVPRRLVVRFRTCGKARVTVRVYRTPTSRRPLRRARRMVVGTGTLRVSLRGLPAGRYTLRATLAGDTRRALVKRLRIVRRGGKRPG